MATELYEQSQTDMINKLLQMLDRQQTEIEVLKAGLEQVTKAPVTTAVGHDRVGSTSRRKLLKRIVLSTVGLTALGVASGVTNAHTAQAGGGTFSTSDDGDGIEGRSASASNSGVYGHNTSTGTGGYGVFGYSPGGTGMQGKSDDGTGIIGLSTTGNGIQGIAKVTNKSGVYGQNDSTGYGVYGSSQGGIGVTGDSTTGNGVRGITSGTSSGVFGENNVNAGGAGVTGKCDNATGIGVSGLSSDGVAVRGQSSNNSGVLGTSTNKNGVWGASSSTSDSGVFGSNGGSGQGVYGYSENGVGIVGYGKNGLGAYFTGSSAPIKLIAASSAGAPTTGSHGKGELYVDSSGELYYCKADGTPGTWVLLSNPEGGGVVAASALNLLATPVRIVDTFDGAPLNNSTGAINGFGSISGGNTSAVNSNMHSYVGRGGASGIPDNASAVTGYIYCNTQSKNFSVKAGYGYLTVWKQGSAYPLASQTHGIVSLYYLHGVASGAAFIVGLSGSGQFSVASDTTTDIIIDITGYYL